MDKDLLLKTRKSLIKHEDYKNFPYRDTKGNITIGVGYNLTSRGLPNSWIDNTLQEDINFFYDSLMKFVWFQALNDDRKIILVEMAFNLGLKLFFDFENMLNALVKKDYDTAANEMLNSEWAKEVGQRAIDLAEGMKTGIYNV